MDYILPDEIYQWAKWVGLVMLPALATLVGSVGPAWGIENVEATVLTLNALGTFIGVIIGASQLTAKPKE